MACVDEHYTEGKRSRRGKIGLHEPAPALFFLLRDLGVAVARQVDEVHGLVDAEKVDMRGLAGGLADAGEVFAQQKLVDDGGFSDVGLARERDLRQAVLRAVGDGGDGADKFRVMQIHAGLLTAGCRACGAFWVRGSALRARREPKLSPLHRLRAEGQPPARGRHWKP